MTWRSRVARSTDRESQAPQVFNTSNWLDSGVPDQGLLHKYHAGYHGYFRLNLKKLFQDKQHNPLLLSITLHQQKATLEKSPPKLTAAHSAPSACSALPATLFLANSHSFFKAQLKHFFFREVIPGTHRKLTQDLGTTLSYLYASPNYFPYIEQQTFDAQRD